MASHSFGLTGARIVAVPSFGSDERIETRAAPGENLAQIVRRIFTDAPDAFLRAYVRVSIGGALWEMGLWAVVRPKPEATVVIRVVPGNGGLLRSVLSIAVSAFAVALGQVWVAPLIGGALGTFAGGLVTATTLLAGHLLINALIPLKREQKQGATSEQRYVLNGFRNDSPIGQKYPSIFGKMRYTPPYAALPYTTIEGGESYLYSIFLLGYGPLKISDIRIGDTPIERFKEVYVETREGRQTDEPLSIYRSQVLQEQLSIDMNKAYTDIVGAHIRSSATDANYFTLDFTLPQGLFWMKTIKQGDETITQPLPFAVDVLIQHRLVGTTTWDASVFQAFGFSQKPFSTTWAFRPPVRGQYEFQVYRLSIDWDDLNSFQQNDQIVSQMMWTGIKSFRPEYPLAPPAPMALIAVKIRASKQLNGVLENLNCIVSRECPDYEYTTGEWVTRETRNPASALRLAKQGPMNVADPVPDSRIDLVSSDASLAQFHDFCRVNNLTYDRAISDAQSLYDVWQEIAAAGRGFPKYDGTKWGVVIDRADRPCVQHFTARECWDVQISRDYVEDPDGFVVSFIDQTSNYKPQERFVPWPGFTGAPNRVERISLTGVTSPDQVWIEARRRMYELIHRRDTLSFTTDFGGAIARRGDFVRFSHDIWKRTQVAARVKHVEGRTILLDEMVTQEAGKSYALRVRSLGIAETESTDLSRLYTLKTIPGESALVVIDQDMPLPAVDDLAMFGELNNETSEWRVLAMEGANDFALRVTCVPHAPIIDELIAAEEPPPWNGRIGLALDEYLEWGIGQALAWGDNLISWA